MFNGWKFNKEINAGELLTIISMLAAACLFVGAVMFNQDKRIERNSYVNDEQTRQIEGISKQMEVDRLERRQDMNRLSDQISDIKNLLIQKQDR